MVWFLPHRWLSPLIRLDGSVGKALEYQSKGQIPKGSNLTPVEIFGLRLLTDALAYYLPTFEFNSEGGLLEKKK